MHTDTEQLKALSGLLARDDVHPPGSFTAACLEACGPEPDAVAVHKSGDLDTTTWTAHLLGGGLLAEVGATLPQGNWSLTSHHDRDGRPKSGVVSLTLWPLGSVTAVRLLPDLTDWSLTDDGHASGFKTSWAIEVAGAEATVLDSQPNSAEQGDEPHTFVRKLLATLASR
jgi:hypothetical protein